MGNFEPISNNGVTFEISASDTLYFANAVNNIGFIERLSISSSTVLSDVTVEVSFLAAAGKISLPYSFTLGTLGSIPFVEQQVGVSFDPNLMFQIPDTQAGTIEVKILGGETLISAASWPIQLLPANFWVAGSSTQDYLALAAFVQPNHPSVRELLNEAVDELKAMGADPTLSGYQQLSHVDNMVEATFRALKKRNITYSNPPASWSGAGGQKIRTPQEVLSEGVGTCLDTAMFFSSAIGQMGLDPVIALVPGHAFVGYWTAASKTEDGNPTMALGPIATIESIVNLLDMGFIRMFETTQVCEDSDADFKASVEGGKLSLENSGAFGAAAYESWLINIRPCHHFRIGINPMPAKFVDPEGNVTIVEYKPEDVDLALLRDAFNQKEGRSGNTIKLDVPPVVKKWLDSLLDLSLRNPLINMRDRATNLRLLLPNSTLGLLEDGLQADKAFQLTSGLSIRDSQGNTATADAATDRGEATLKAEKILKESFSQQVIHSNTTPDGFITRLRKINSEAKSFQEETGSNGLYLALGTLTWKTSTAEIQSPLILVPVTLTAKNRNRDFYISIEESGVTPNFSLVEKLKVERNLNLDGLANLQTDNFGVDVEGTFDYVREQLNKAGLNDFRVDMTATLGLFNFSSFRLWKDMLENWQKFERNPLVKHLIHTPNEAFVDPCVIEPNEDLDSLIAQLPIPADGSQAQAVSKAIAGKTFILQGPPGTGKSQTITNLLAKALDEGKRVLFVAEKKDALDVVKVRMDQSGIGAFSLDLHDKGSTSKAVREQLGDVIDILIDADKSGFEAALQDYELALGPLKKYREQLHEVGTLGESVYSAKQKFLSIASDQQLPIPGEYIAKATIEEKHELLEAAKSLNELGVSAGTAPTNPWSFSGLEAKSDNVTQSRVKELVVSIQKTFESANADQDFKAFLSNCQNSADLLLLTALAGESMPPSAVEFGATTAGREQIDFAVSSLQAVLKEISRFKYSVEKLNTKSAATVASALEEAKSSGFLTRSFKISKVYKGFCRDLGVNSPFLISDLEAEIVALVKLEKLVTKANKELEKLNGMRFDDDLNLYSDEQSAEALQQTIQLRKLVDLATFKVGNQTAQSLVTNSSTPTREAMVGLALGVDELFNLLGATEASVELWIGEAKFSERLTSSIPSWKQDALEYGLTPYLRWVTLLKAASPFYRLGLDQAVEDLLSGKAMYEHAANSFEKGFYRTLFENLLVVQGLNSFDGTSINNFIRKLNDSHDRLRERLPKILGAELLSRRGFDSSMKIGAIGDLMLAIKQSRNSMPLRTLLSRHWDIITRITPCVLASPDSAVRFIDPTFEAFDLVVFDEASQIRVANAVGALGRAKAAVVVGDSEQMPPTSVAQSKAGSSEEDEAEDDSFLGDPESILTQCEIARVPDIMLNWHYRSEDESLIAFSNQQYYGGKLSTFPTPNLSPQERSLQFVQVSDGQFIRSADEDKGIKAAGPLRTNPAEAKAILEEVISRLETPATASDSIGIVTFNLQQRNLIQSMLYDSSNKALVKALEEGVGGEPIFVKNLESVQGNERDAILFSVAFSSKKSDPKNLPMNFGPITHAGGHKRLNVAITRARKEVKIFCSFKPGLLLEKNPPSRGLRDLANYLVMASATDRSEIASLATREAKLDQHRSDVFKVLKSAGLPVIEEVGLSDFKVDVALLGSGKNPKAVLGILLDGPRWQSRLTVSDRDCLPVSLLKTKMGWPAIERIWLPNWIRDQKGEVSRIKDAYESALKTPASKMAKVVKSVEPIFTQKVMGDESANGASNPVDVLLDQTDTWMQLATEEIASQEFLNYLHDKRVRDAVQHVISELSRIEGPVSKERIGKFVANCFGYSRVVPGRIDAIYSIVPKTQARDAEGFVFPIGVKVEDWSEWRKSNPGEGRPAEEISLTEIANAMRDISRVAGGVRYEQLVKETSRVFGIQKLSSKALARFEEALKWGMKHSRLVSSGEYITAAI
jgi:SpoU rRNA methylase family enzyme